MEGSNQSNDIFDQPQPKLTGLLNVLTILTFIGCGLSYISAFWSYFGMGNPDSEIAKMREQQEKLGTDSGFAYKMMESGIDIYQKSYDNRHLLFAAGLLFTTLCLIGAMRMRKLRKSGYYIYLVGELAPIVLMAGLFGSSFLSAIQLLFVALIAAVFVILYSTQLKYFVNK